MKTTRIAIAISLVLADRAGVGRGLAGAGATDLGADRRRDRTVQPPDRHLAGHGPLRRPRQARRGLATGREVRRHRPHRPAPGLHRGQRPDRPRLRHHRGQRRSQRQLRACGSPARATLTFFVERRGFDFFYDRDSERRDPGFPAPPPPPALADTPALDWDRDSAGLKFHVAEGLNFSLAANHARGATATRPASRAARPAAPCPA